jgi:hypothetical protein
LETRHVRARAAQLFEPLGVEDPWERRRQVNKTGSAVLVEWTYAGSTMNYRHGVTSIVVTACPNNEQHDLYCIKKPVTADQMLTFTGPAVPRYILSEQCCDV